MIYGIRNRGNICYASSVIQCICRILDCIPPDVTDLDKIPRIPSDAQEFYESLISKMPLLKSKVLSRVSDVMVPCVLSSQMDELKEAGEIFCLRVAINSSIKNLLQKTICGSEYQLIGLVSFSSGHYVAAIERGDWYLCNDADVYKIDISRQLSMYLLFYKKLFQ